MGEFVEGNNWQVSVGTGSGNVYQTKPAKVKVEPKVPDEKTNPEGDLIPWGDDNLLPQKLLKAIRKNSIIGPTLAKKAEIAYDEIVYGVEEMDDQGKVVFKRVIDPQVEAFFQRSKIHRYVISALRNFYYFYFATPRLILTADRKEIYSISNYKTAHFRFGRQDNFGNLVNGYICADWESISDLKDKHVEKIPLVDIWGTPMDLKERKEFKFIYPLAYPTEDELFYPLVDWNAARESGWFEVAQSIPKWKKALFENQVTIKYHVSIPSSWWLWKYPDFNDMDTQKRRKTMDLEYDLFEKRMVGVDKAGNSIFTTFPSGPDVGQEYKDWTITAIDNKIPDGMFNSDSNEASSHLLYALGMDPAIIGSQPGSKLGAGSGSDKRVAFNIYLDTILAHMNLILEPMPFIGIYNGWKPYKYYLKNWLLAQLQKDTGKGAPSKDPKKEPQQQAA